MFLCNFFLKEVLSDISKVPAGCTLNGSRVYILCSADDLVIVAPTAKALYFLLTRLTSILYTLSLQETKQKSSNIVLGHINEKIVNKFDYEHQAVEASNGYFTLRSSVDL